MSITKLVFSNLNLCIIKNAGFKSLAEKSRNFHLSFFDYLLLHHPDFVKGNYNVSFIENHADEILSWDKAVSDIDE